MNREQIIEAMAASAHEAKHKGMRNVYTWGDAGLIADHRDYVEGALREMSAALTALEATIPGLADVIAGKAVVVPVEPTEAMIEAGKLRVLEKYLSPRATAYQSFRAMLEASPLKGE